MQNLDFVITWVDGSDQKLQAKRNQYCKSVETTRFASDEEIYFCIASILKYVPYCRTIYLVTDQQQPTWLTEFVAQGICTADKIQVIDHQVLFDGYTQYLPTFNSLSLETMLWNIPNISSKFIYLNDDFFFNAPSKIEDFLVDNKVVIYGHWQKNIAKKFKYEIKKLLSKTVSAKYTVAQMLSAEMVGLSQYFEIHHRPHLINKDLLRQFFKENTHILNEQIQFKFRHHQQFLPVGLSNHLAIQKDQATLKNDLNIAYLKNQKGVERWRKELHDDSIKFGCVQSLDQLDITHKRVIQQDLIKKFEDFLPSQILEQK